MTGLIAIGITVLLGLISAVVWNKIEKIREAIKLIADALADKVITQEELEDILKALGVK